MKLRKLDVKDAPFMLEWMHSIDIVENLQADFTSKTVTDCVNFISLAQNPSKDLHLAIVDDNDEYMGTVSLKHITNKNAEFAITIRKKAMGKGFSQYGMNKIINYGLKKYGLEEVYWCVSPENKRAVRFYDKNGYKRSLINENIELLDTIKKFTSYTDNQIEEYIWYVACSNEKKFPEL